MHSDSLDPERYLSYVPATSPQAARSLPGKILQAPSILC